MQGLGEVPRFCEGRGGERTARRGRVGFFICPVGRFGTSLRLQDRRLGAVFNILTLSGCQPREVERPDSEAEILSQQLSKEEIETR